MPAQTIYADSGNMKHGSIDPMAYPPQPGSPTLTNPDMILPDYEYGRADSPDEQLPEPMRMWNNNRDSNNESSNASASHQATLRNQMFPPESFVAGPMTPTTPIIYGNGTMLSDIGEVTEVESNTGAYGGRRTSSRYSAQSVEDITVRSSPTMGTGLAQRLPQATQPRERRASIESTSTIRSAGHAHFTDFDDAASVDDTSFHGDDEESMASSWVDDNPSRGYGAVQQQMVVQRAAAPQDTHSPSAISQRAEQILANAKRRLTTMEGNLSRARTSLSNYSASEGSSPGSPSRTRTGQQNRISPPTTSRHTRNKSEDGLPPGQATTTFQQRSASALGAAGGYRKPRTALTSEALHQSITRSDPQGSNHPVETTLEVLSEDDNGSGLDSARTSGIYNNLMTPTFGAFSDRNMSRSSSAAQVREIQDQMQGLKGKISTLRQQAQADSLKRRSLQSLRTPSPFTHSRWENGFGGSGGTSSAERSPVAMEHEDESKTPTEYVTPGYLFPETTQRAPQQHAEPAPVDVDEGEDPLKEKVEEPFNPEEVGKALSPEVEDDHVQPPGVFAKEASREDGNVDDDLQTENGDAEEKPVEEHEEDDFQEVDDVSEPEAAEGSTGGDGMYPPSEYESDAEGSLYHDTFQHPISHEDREDAFDYEHFFLHSAMGNLRHGRRDSLSSTGSDESIRTAKGPDRRASMDSMASSDSFETAYDGDGRASRAVAEKKASEVPRTRPGVPSYKTHRSQPNSFSGFRFSDNDVPSQADRRPQTSVAVQRPGSAAQAASLHRPSISSFESTGTNRSFPLVNKARLNGGVITPSQSPDHAASGKLTPAGLSMIDGAATPMSPVFPSVMQMLGKDDQLLVEGLIAGLGNCVMRLSEGSRASTEGRLNIRRLEAARRILEGLEEV